MAFSPNGSTVASGSEDGTVRLWDATTQRETAQLQGHSGTVHSVSYSPDGSKIVSGGMDETVRLWDVASQRLIETRHGHTNEVSSVAFLPDGSRIASGSADGTILIWESGSPSQPPGGNGANTRPVARAGEDQSVDKRETVTLDGSNSSDPEGQPLNFTWRQIEGIQVILSNPKIARPTIDTLEPDNYVFELVVHDGTIASVPDTVVVEIVSIADAAVKVGGPDAAFMHKTTTGDQVTFTVRGTAPPVQVGEVMVNTVEPYFLKKVTRLVSQNENEVVIETEDAALTDVIEDATIRRSFRIPAAKLALSSPPATGEITLHSDDTARLSLTSYDISLPREYWLEADIKIFSLKSLEVAVTGDLIATLGMDLAAYSSFSVNADKTVGQLPPFTFKTFVGWIPVTVTIQGKLSVGVDYNATAAGRITAGITISKPVAIGVEYEDGSWQELTGGSPATHDVHEPTLDLQGSVSVRGYVRGQLDVEILQVGGPYFGVRSYLSFDAVKNQSSKQIDWQLHTGIDGYSGVKTTIFGKIGIWDFDVDKSWNFNLYMALLKDGIIPLAEVISFDLHSGTVLSHGITYSNNRFYVGAWVESRSWLHAYTESGQRDWSSDIYLRRGRVLAPEIIVPSGLTYGNKRLYMVFPGHSGAAGYLGYTESLEERDGSLTELNSDNDAPTGLTFANNRLYVVDGHDAKVYGYTSSGQPDSDADFDLDSNNDSPTGITFANSRFYVVDGNDVNVYGYTSSGQRDSEVDFDLDSNNDSPTGITFANNRFYVVDAHNRKIYGYASPDPKNSTDSFQSTRSLP
ncbi:MAG: PKD domain-containing protein [Gemmatimonadota bacterium]|nr:PKD domain-containing protein [Gemmatimonadota bacterium]